MTTRAKFYVSRVETHGGHDGGAMGTTVHFNIVYSQKPGTENHSFWKASPNGTLRLTMAHGDPQASLFAPGSFWYADVSPVEAVEGQSLDEFLGAHVRNYALTGLSRPYKGGLGVVLERPQFFREHGMMMGRGRLEVTVDNQEVWPVFASGLDSRYEVVLLPAS